MKKIYKLLVVSLLLVFVSLFVLPQKIWAVEYCCPPGFTSCQNGGIGNDRLYCELYKLSDDTCLRMTFSNPLFPKMESAPAISCDIEPNSNLSGECEWTTLNNSESPYNGNLALCIGGFPSEETINNTVVEFKCTKNCGGAGTQLYNSIFNESQKYKFSDLNGDIVTAGSGQGKYTCLVMSGFDNSVQKTVDYCLDPPGLAGAIIDLAGCAITAGASELTAGATGITFQLTALGAACGLPALGQGGISNVIGAIREKWVGCAPEIEAIATTNGAKFCEDKLSLNINPDIRTNPVDISDQGDKSYARIPYDLCKQVSNNQGSTAFKNCTDCANGTGKYASMKNGIWTAIGCIDTNPTKTIETFIRVGLSIAGGVALLMILAAGFMLSMSQGDPKRTGEAREMITSAIVGILFIIFSITLLRLIGISILRIPGIG